MRNSQISKCAILMPLLLLLSSCGFDLKEVYDNDGYNSPIFKENYYTKYSDAIDPNKENKIIDTKEVILNSNTVAHTYEQAKKMNIDADMTKLDYSTDFKDDKYVGVGYGPTKKMNTVDDIFKYGYVSKLFDGQMFCNGGYELVRVQVAESGFGVVFDKEIAQYDYFAMNFKVVLNDPLKEINLLGTHLSSIKLNLSFYIRDGGTLTQIKLVDELNDLYTNGMELNGNAPNGPYVFYALDLLKLKIDHGVDLTRCVGFSIDYQLIEDEVMLENPDHEFNYALMLYEVMWPNSSWK